jgi:hypothetical protein
VAAVFQPGTLMQTIVQFIRSNAKPRSFAPKAESTSAHNKTLR